MKPLSFAFVSDHAVLRYLERVMGVDVEAARDLIAARVERGARPGASGVSFNGYTYIIQATPDRPTVTTVLKGSGVPCQTGDFRA